MRVGWLVSSGIRTKDFDIFGICESSEAPATFIGFASEL